MKTLYVSDMDGTLLDSSSRLSPETVVTINKAIAEGALFTVATARTPATLSGLLKDVNLQLPAIVMTGVTTWHRDTNKYYSTHHFQSSTARDILNVYQQCRLPSFIYTLRDNMINIYHYGPLSDLEIDFISGRYNSPFKKFHLSPLQCKMFEGKALSNEESSAIWDECLDYIPEKISDAVLFFAMQHEDIGRPAYEQLKSVGNINPMFYFDTVYPENAMIEAFPGAATKAKAIQNLAKELKVDRIVVFGDNRNDIPMMRIADIAVAVGNAIPEAKEAADIIIGSNDSGAVADFILNDFKKHK